MSKESLPRLAPHPVPPGFLALFQRLWEAVLIVEVGTDRIAFANEAAERIFGLPAAELVGQPLASRVQLASDGKRDRLTDGHAFEAVARRATGETFVVEVSLAPCGEPDAYLAVVVRRLAEPPEARTRGLTEAEAGAREAQLLAIVGQATDGIWIKDLTGRHVFINAAGAEITGFPIDAVIGRRDEALYPAESIPSIRERDRRIAETGVPETYEISIRHPRKGMRTYFSIKFPYRLPSGEIAGVVVITRDITERKQLEQAVKDQLVELRQLDGLKTDFVNAVSHELRTPLTSIMGYVEFLEDEVGGSLTAQQSDFLREIDLATKRLTRLVDDLLDFARIQAGTFVLHRSRFDLAAKIAEIAASFKPQLAHAGLTLSVEADAPLPMDGDPERLGQVLINVLSNALKFTPEGGRIVVRGVRRGDRLRVEIQDTGTGIAPEEMTRLFQKFSQLEAGKQKGGTGLGLSISKVIVESHGGAIGVTDAPGGGSLFWFEVPAA